MYLIVIVRQSMPRVGPTMRVSFIGSPEQSSRVCRGSVIIHMLFGQCMLPPHATSTVYAISGEVRLMEDAVYYAT